jgi:parallel beta-helix repeat protein
MPSRDSALAPKQRRHAGRLLLRIAVALLLPVLLLPLIRAAGGDIGGSTLASATTYVSDSFNRTVNGNWGQADIGGSYAISGSTSDFRVANRVGHITLPKAGVTRSAVLGAVSQRDIDLEVRFQLDRRPSHGSGLWIYAVARRTAAQDSYLAKVRIKPDGAVSVGASKVVAGSETPIGNEVALAATYAAGSQWVLRARFTGASPTNIGVSAWPSSGSAPSSWHLTRQDSAAALQKSGSTGLIAYSSSGSSNAPFAISFQNYVVTSAGSSTGSTQSPSPSPTPTPGSSGKAYYVSPTGNDGNPGTLAAPWKSLQKAADTVPAGSTIYMRGGTHGPFVMRRSGTSSAPITFTAYGTEKPVVDGKKAVPYTIKIVGASYVRFTNLTIQGSFDNGYSGAGITAENSSYVEIRNNLIVDNKAWGVRSFNSTHVTIDGNEVSQNAVGIHVGRAGQGTTVTNNLVHTNNKMIVNTANISGDDSGGEGVALVMTTGTVTVRGNRIWANRASSYDYGYDGGAFSIYGASNWIITENVAWNNRNVLESGTDGSKTPCNNGRFTRNVVYGAATVDRSVGMALRCASNTLVANNTFHGTDSFAFDISHNKGTWGGSIEGLQIVNNIVSISNGKVYGIETFPLPSSVVINNNLLHNAGTGYLVSVIGLGGTISLATFRLWTGFEKDGIAGHPRFVDPARHDYRLRADSPAIDQGRIVNGVTDGFRGTAPDIGRFEY